MGKKLWTEFVEISIYNPENKNIYRHALTLNNFLALFVQEKDFKVDTSILMPLHCTFFQDTILAMKIRTSGQHKLIFWSDVSGKNIKMPLCKMWPCWASTTRVCQYAKVYLIRSSTSGSVNKTILRLLAFLFFWISFIFRFFSARKDCQKYIYFQFLWKLDS